MNTGWRESQPAPEVSVVVPVLGDGREAAELVKLLARELGRLERESEFVLVLDGSRQALPALEGLDDGLSARLTVLVLGRSFGESVALAAGLERARGAIVVTSSEDLRIEPSGLEAILARLDAGADLVVARRFPRHDRWLSRMQSELFHLFVRRLTATPFRDMTSGFRVMRREVAKGLDLYGDLHRFIPILAGTRGFRVEEVDVPQRPSRGGGRGHTLPVYLRRLLDILTVFFLTRFTQKPLRFFGGLALLLLLLGGGILLYLGAYRLLGLGGIADRPMLLLGLLLVVLGVQGFSIGLLGELIIFTHSQRARPYQVVEVVERDHAEGEGDGKGGDQVSGATR